MLKYAFKLPSIQRKLVNNWQNHDKTRLRANISVKQVQLVTTMRWFPSLYLSSSKRSGATSIGIVRAQARQDESNSKCLHHPYGKREEFHRSKQSFAAKLGRLIVIAPISTASVVQQFFVLEFHGRSATVLKFFGRLMGKKQSNPRKSEPPASYAVSGGSNE